MTDLGQTLRAAREAAGLSLSGMARRTGYSIGYLGNVETGERNATPKVIRAYERVLGMDRRSLLAGVVVVAVGAVPDVAVDVFRDISAERNKLLSTVQTSHATDKTIGGLIARDAPCVGSLTKWARRGSSVLRVNSVGILAKVRSPVLDNDVVLALRADEHARQLYLTAVVSRVLGMPWEDASHLARQQRPLSEAGHVAALAREIANPYDSGARWCALTLLARTRPYDANLIDPALHHALNNEPAREMLRAIGGVLAGLDPITLQRSLT